MERILTVTATEQHSKMLQQLLTECGLPEPDAALDGLHARRKLEEQQYDLVVVDSPLSDEHGEAIARMADQKDAAVILIVKPEHADAVRERIRQTGVYLIMKPLKRAIFAQLIQCIQMQKKQLQAVAHERDKLKRQMQEINLQNRAKLLLMQVLKLSESQAHHYIEKQAMDLRISKREVAEGIINAYEN